MEKHRFGPRLLRKLETLGHRTNPEYLALVVHFIDRGVPYRVAMKRAKKAYRQGYRVKKEL